MPSFKKGIDSISECRSAKVLEKDYMTRNVVVTIFWKSDGIEAYSVVIIPPLPDLEYYRL
jgi:hypothetical protein